VEIMSTDGVRINECLLSGDSGNGFVELFNAGVQAADLGGLRLGDSPESLPFTIPAGTTLPPGALAAFGASELGFRLPAIGGVVYLESADRSRFLDVTRRTERARGFRRRHH
jgi:hypothetical protein